MKSFYLRQKQKGASLVIIVIVVFGIVIGVISFWDDIVDAITGKAEEHPATVKSYETAGLALCEKLHTTATAQMQCSAQVMAESARALAAGSGFNIAACTMIPAGSWP